MGYRLMLEGFMGYGSGRRVSRVWGFTVRVTWVLDLRLCLLGG